MYMHVKDDPMLWNSNKIKQITDHYWDCIKFHNIEINYQSKEAAFLVRVSMYFYVHALNWSIAVLGRLVEVTCSSRMFSVE